MGITLTLLRIDPRLECSYTQEGDLQTLNSCAEMLSLCCCCDIFCGSVAFVALSIEREKKRRLIFTMEEMMCLFTSLA